ncbi:MAG: DUF6273 domain-containing protein [Clostridiales Family XIII bacterium]|jgi:hypothetical protein|nr:DUF6273 domain-containing protein [Clostridiales Family XIII bacterium]
MNTQKYRGKILSGILALSLVIGLFATMPIATEAADSEIQAGTPTLTVSDSSNVGTVIGFAGQEWYVIGYNPAGDVGGTGVYSGVDDSATLLVKGNGTASEVYGDTAFRTGTFSDPNDSDNYKFYLVPPSTNTWYMKNPSDPQWTYPAEYRGSTLQQRMETIATAFSPKEQGVINARTLTADDDAENKIIGGDVADQKLWALSYNEAKIIEDSAVIRYGKWWWLRSPFNNTTKLTVLLVDESFDNWSVGNSGSGVQNIDPAARPAFNLNLNSAIFTSSASGGKSATVGSDLTATGTPTGKLKFTFEDSTLSLDVADTAPRIVKSGDSVGIDYTGAITGADKYVSAVIVDETGTLFYGKLVDLNSGDGSDGTATFTVPSVLNLPEGNYTLRIFNEEIGGENFSDFSSTPVDIPLIVDNSIKVDKSALQNELELADTIKWGGKNKTPAWKDFEKARNAANAVFNDAAATQEEIDLAIENLVAAKKALNISESHNWLDDVDSHIIGTEDNLIHIISHDWSLHTGVVKVDGISLTLGEDYTSESGSTRTTLLASYLDMLPPGTHTMTVEFSDGINDISDDFIISRAPVGNVNNNGGNGEGGSVDTGDDFPIALTVLLLCGTTLAMLISIIALRRRMKV